MVRGFEVRRSCSIANCVVAATDKGCPFESTNFDSTAAF
jgi:hypothetical protein